MRSISHAPTLFVIAISTWVGCGGLSSPPPPPPTEQLEQAFQHLTEATQGPAEAKTLHLYVDGSSSMSGYVSNPDSVYVRALERALDSFTASDWEFEVSKFGESVQKVEDSSEGSMTQRSFYNQRNTSFPDVLAAIAAERGKGVVSVVVSDMVQSRSGTGQRDLAQAFQEVAETNPQVLLLGMRSQFVGSYWPESAGGRGNRLSVRLEGPEAFKLRPFYFLFIADRRADLELARKKLTRDLQAQEVDAAQPAIELVSTTWPRPGAIPSQLAAWSLYDTPTQRRPETGPFRSRFSFVRRSGDLTQPASLTVYFEAGDNGPLPRDLIDSGDDLEFRVHKATFSDGNASRAQEVELQPVGRLAEDDRGLNVRYAFPTPTPNSWDAYHITIYPGPANVQPPFWVADWSVHRDDGAHYANRTLKLDLFVETLLRSLTEKVPLAEQTVLIGRGDS